MSASIVANGLRTGIKSDLVGCLEDLDLSRQSSPSPRVEVNIIDGAAIVNMLRPGAAKTFSEYAEQVFLPYIISQLQHVSRMDVVWDEYFDESLKAETRSKREREFIDVLSQVVPFLESGRNFSASTVTRSSCSLSWQRG